jgi:Cof subfamily protein (haloacid dehalogenase superfamily)
MGNYKIVASDLDGTLLNKAGKISPENLAAIGEMAERGIWFVPASGRGLSEMPEQIKACEDIRYVLYSNGAAVLDRKTGEKLLCCLPKELSVEILDILDDYDVHITQRQGGECYIDAFEQGPEKYEYYHMGKAHAFITWNYGIHKEDFHAFSRTLEDVELYVVHFHDPAERRACLERLTALGKYAIAEANPNSLEISMPAATKGNALLRLADHLGIAHEDTIGMGDSDNDTTMVQAAGLGLAMENACDSLKETADEVICDNDAHGVRYVLEHYC